VVSIDVPSGWDVDGGEPSRSSLQPAMLVSLTAPKKCAAYFRGHHWLGGRFLTPDIARTYGLETLLAKYEGCDQVVKLS
jgi:NAD(P)H-hydrate epimerase